MIEGHTSHISEFLQTVDLITDFAISDKEKVKMIEEAVAKEYTRLGVAKKEIIADIDKLTNEIYNIRNNVIPPETINKVLGKNEAKSKPVVEDKP